MIYVIESSGYKKKDSGERVYFSILKIGFTEDSNKERRYGSYRNHNPFLRFCLKFLEAQRIMKRDCTISLEIFFFMGMNGLSMIRK